jgi:CBS domain containing-hemolysin-like protein
MSLGLVFIVLLVVLNAFVVATTFAIRIQREEEIARQRI